MAVRQYVGARYVPLFGRKGENSILWDNSAPYEPLTIVLYQGNSYTSRQYVPVGVDINNEEFWALTGNYNAQVEQYRREVMDFQDDIETLTGRVKNAETSVATIDGRVDSLDAAMATADDNITDIFGKLLLKAPIASPAFTGIPTTPTPLAEADGGQIANVEFVNNVRDEVNLKANTASPALTGIPTTPTPATDDNSTQIANTQFVQGIASAIRAQIEAIGSSGIKNVMDFGAVADGRTSDSLAFQNAIAGGGVVIVPPGTYRIATDVVLESGLCIIGYGAKLVLDFNGSSGYAFRFHTTSPDYSLYNVVVEGFEIDGSGAAGTIGGFHFYQPAAISSDLIDRIVLRNLYIHDVSGRGIDIFGSASGDGTSGHGHPRIYVENTLINNTGSWGICNSGTSSRFFNVNINTTGTECMSVDNGSANVMVQNCRFNNAQGGAGCVSVDEANTVQFANCLFVQPTGSSIPAFRANCSSGNVLHLMLTQCYMYGGSYGLSIGGTNYFCQVLIEGCRCTGSSNGVLSRHENDYIVSGGNNWFTPMTADNKSAIASKIHDSSNNNSIF